MCIRLDIRYVLLLLRYVELYHKFQTLNWGRSGFSHMHTGICYKKILQNAIQYRLPQLGGNLINYNINNVYT